MRFGPKTVCHGKASSLTMKMTTGFLKPTSTRSMASGRYCFLGCDLIAVPLKSYSKVECVNLGAAREILVIFLKLCWLISHIMIQEKVLGWLVVSWNLFRRSSKETIANSPKEILLIQEVFVYGPNTANLTWCRCHDIFDLKTGSKKSIMLGRKLCVSARHSSAWKEGLRSLEE